MVGHFLDLRAQGALQHLGADPFGGHAIEHKELRATAHQTVVGAHVVCQPLVALRQRTFQARTAVAVQHRSQHRERQRIVVLGRLVHRGQARHLEGQGDIALLGRGLEFHTAQPFLRRLLLRFALGHGLHRQTAVMLFGQLAHLLGFHIACHHDDRIGRAVPAFVEIAGVLWGHGVQIAHPAHDRAAVGRSGERGGRQHFVQQGAGVVLGAQAALLFHHFQLFGKFGIGPLVVHQTVGFQLHHGVEPTGRNLLKVPGVVLGGEGVFAPTQRRHAARELARLKLCRALEHHVFEHMGHTAGAVDFVHRAHAQPDHVHCRGRTPVGSHPQRHAIGQGVGESGLRCSRRCCRGLGLCPGQRRQQGRHQGKREKQAGFHKMDHP